MRLRKRLPFGGHVRFIYIYIYIYINGVAGLLGLVWLVRGRV